jgi:hypothetical protein
MLEPTQSMQAPKGLLTAYLFLCMSKEQIDGLKPPQNWPQCQ